MCSQLQHSGLCPARQTGKGRQGVDDLWEAQEHSRMILHNAVVQEAGMVSLVPSTRAQHKLGIRLDEDGSLNMIVSAA